MPYEEKNITKYRYLVDMTLLSKLKNGLKHDELFDNLKTVLDRKVTITSQITPRTTRPNRDMKFRSIELPKQLHLDVVAYWTWFWKTRGAGGVLNATMEDVILDMRAKGYVSFNDYCDKEIRRKVDD